MGTGTCQNEVPAPTPKKKIPNMAVEEGVWNFQSSALDLVYTSRVSFDIFSCKYVLRTLICFSNRFFDPNGERIHFFFFNAHISDSVCGFHLVKSIHFKIEFEKQTRS